MILYSILTNKTKGENYNETAVMVSVLPRQPGYVGYCFLKNEQMYWLYNSRDAAISARDVIKALSITCSDEINEFEWDGISDVMRVRK